MTINRVRTHLATSILGCALLVSPAHGSTLQQEETAEQFIERTRRVIVDDEWDRAKTRLRRLLSLKPDSAEAHFMAGQVYMHEGARSMAIESLEKAITDKPVYPEAHFLLARCFLDAGRPVKAREEVNTAISQGTPLFPAYVLVGEIDIAENKLEEAVLSFEAALGVSGTGDEIEAARLRGQLDDLLAMIENLKRFAVLKAAQSSPDIVRPVLLNSVTPHYTAEASDLKIQGVVSMAIHVTENGDVDSVLLFRKSGPGLGERAEQTARNLKFSPANSNGQPIPYWVKLSISFNLR